MKPILSIITSFLILLFVIGVQSCKKDNVEDLYGPPPCDTTFMQNYSFDTVYPSDYIMAYPGSWWEYSDGHIDSCFNWATVSIVNNTYSGNCVTVHEDKKILPRTSFGYFSFESKVQPYSNFNPTWIEPCLDTNLGMFWDHQHSYHAPNGNNNSSLTTIQKEVVEHLDSINLGGITYFDVLHVYEYRSIYFYHVFNGPHWTNDFYYARNVGIIKQYSTYMDNPTIDRTLTSHFISPH